MAELELLDDLMNRLGGPETYEVVVHENTSDINGRAQINGLVPDDFCMAQRPSIVEVTVTEIKTHEPWHIVTIQLIRGDMPKAEMKIWPTLVRDDRNYGSLRMTIVTGGSWYLVVVFTETRQELTSHVKLRLTKRVWHDY